MGLFDILEPSIIFEFIYPKYQLISMKPIAYVQKYSLNNPTWNINYDEFHKDLKADFIELVESQVLKSQSLASYDAEWDLNVGNPKPSIYAFKECINQMRAKFEGINQKTNGVLPEHIWNKLYAAVICKVRDKLFPEIQKEFNTLNAMTPEQAFQWLSQRGLITQEKLVPRTLWNEQSHLTLNEVCEWMMTKKMLSRLYYQKSKQAEKVGALKDQTDFSQVAIKKVSDYAQKRHNSIKKNVKGVDGQLEELLGLSEGITQKEASQEFFAYCERFPEAKQKFLGEYQYLIANMDSQPTR